MLIALCTACAKTPAEDIPPANMAVQSAANDMSEALITQSELVFSKAPDSTVTSLIGFTSTANIISADSYSLAGVYDIDAQTGRYLCYDDSCTHSDSSCAAYLTNIRGTFYGARYSAYVMNNGGKQVLRRYDYGTGEMRETALSQDLIPENSFFDTSDSGFAIDGDTLYVAMSTDGVSGSKILSLNTLTGDAKIIADYPAACGIFGVCENSLIVYYSSNSKIEQDTLSFNTTFSVYEALPIDGTAATQLFLFPAQTREVCVDSATHAIYYSNFNPVIDAAKDQTRYDFDGIIHRLDIITGAIDTVGEVPTDGCLGINLTKSADNYLIVSLRKDGDTYTRYKLNLDTQAAEIFSLTPPDSSVYSVELTNSYAGDSMIIYAPYAQTPTLYSITKSDFFAGISNYNKLAGSEIIWHYD